MGWDWKPIDHLGDKKVDLVRGLWQPWKGKADGEEEGKEESELGTEHWGGARAQEERSRILAWMAGRQNKPT